MYFPTFDREDIRIIHNRSKENYDEIYSTLHENKKAKSNNEIRLTPLPESGIYYNAHYNDDKINNDLNLDNLDFTILKSIITVNTALQYLNEKTNNE